LERLERDDDQNETTLAERFKTNNDDSKTTILPYYRDWAVENSNFIITIKYIKSN